MDAQTDMLVISYINSMNDILIKTLALNSIFFMIAIFALIIGIISLFLAIGSLIDKKLKKPSEKSNQINP